MKSWTRFFAVLTFALTASTQALAISDGSGFGNGTDYVTVLFADAQADLNRLLDSVGPENIADLPIASEFKNWLLERPAGSARLIQLKYYLKKMEFKFQDNPPCHDDVGHKNTICFMQGDRGQPLVMIAIDENRLTTKEQAMAMLVHEAGHFTGEMNHLFLDDVGVALVQALLTPRVIVVQYKSTEIVPNVFAAKAGCDQGTSQQALTLKEKAKQEITRQCAEQKRKCNLSKISYVFEGDDSWRDGVGFTMKVTCSVKAELAP